MDFGCESDKTEPRSGVTISFSVTLSRLPSQDSKGRYFAELSMLPLHLAYMTIQCGSLHGSSGLKISCSNCKSE